MKANVLRKFKWYLFGAIAIAIILSIGLSFCTWDTQSVAKQINGGSANFHHDWKRLSVGEDFTDNNGLRWLVVDKSKTGNTTNMVLMTYYVTEQRVYEATMTNPDYNSAKNNIRSYLNNTWYPTIDAEIRSYVVPKTTAYAPGTIFYQWGDNNPQVIPVAATSNMAWLPSSDEIGLGVRNIDDRENNDVEFLKHDDTFTYFPLKLINWPNDPDIGGNARRIATTESGETVYWWTRTGVYSHMVVVVNTTGAYETSSPHWMNQNNWLRPCVQVQFSE